MDRDEYVEKLKAEIDRWNAEMAKLEARVRQGQATLKTEYAAQLEQFRKRHDDAIVEMRRLGARARASFDKKKQRAGNTGRGG